VGNFQQEKLQFRTEMQGERGKVQELETTVKQLTRDLQEAMRTKFQLIENFNLEMDRMRNIFKPKRQQK